MSVPGKFLAPYMEADSVTFPSDSKMFPNHENKNNEEEEARQDDKFLKVSAFSDC